MNNGDISDQNLDDEQDSGVNSEERRNQSNLKETIDVVSKVVNTPMNPTPLFVLLFFRHL